MAENEAIEELKYDCNELGKAIPCDTSWGCSFENAYGMAIQALEKQIPKKVKIAEREFRLNGIALLAENYCVTMATKIPTLNIVINAVRH